MITVQCYTLPLPRYGEPLVQMPRAAWIVHVAFPGSARPGWERAVVLYAVVDKREPTVTRRFIVANTGEPLGPHVGLVHLRSLRTADKHIHIFDTGVEAPHGD